MGGLRFGIDGDGNYGYYGADDSLIPFSRNKGIFIPISGAWTQHNKATHTYDASSYNNGLDVSKATVYPIVKEISQGTGTVQYSASISSSWVVTITSSGYTTGENLQTLYHGVVVLFE